MHAQHACPDRCRGECLDGQLPGDAGGPDAGSLDTRRSGSRDRSRRRAIRRHGDGSERYRPAYVFLFIEAFMDAAVHLGFQRDMALELVLQTMEGSLKLARSSQKNAAELKNSVTSPGGTAAEAVYELEKAGFRTALSKAVWAAYQRTLTLKD